MSQEILMPNYNHSILNLITSILQNYHVPTTHDSLDEITKLLKNKYKNIVLIILDGMGENVLQYASPNGFFNHHKETTLTSVFPSTTTAALTTYYSGKPPFETGWIAWSQYFKEYGRAIDMLPYRDSYTGELLPRNSFDAYDALNYETVYDQIEQSSDAITYEIKPTHCDMKAKRCIHIKNIEEMCDSIRTLCKNNDESKYIFSYFDSPDNLNHKNGWDSNITKEFILYAEDLIEKLYLDLKNSNTLLLVSADHGHNTICHNYQMLELEDLQECFIMPPTLEPRFITFWIKESKKTFFEQKFKEKFNEAFLLYTKEDFLDLNLLGYGKKHIKIDDFIGDYVAIAISDSAITLGTHLSKEKDVKLSSHCGLTKNEMEVPLIVLK